MHVSESLDGRVVVFSVDYKNLKSSLVNKKGETYYSFSRERQDIRSLLAQGLSE